MQNIFIYIFSLFHKKKWVFYLSLISIVLFSALGISKLHLEENINSIIPKGSALHKATDLLSNTKFADQLIFTVELIDTTVTEPDKLQKYAAAIVSLLETDTLINKIRFQMNDDNFLRLYDFFYNHIYLYLSENDYLEIEKKLTHKGIDETLKSSYKSLLSPAGIATKKFILKDPLNLTPIALKKLQNFQIDDNFIIENNHIYTKDKKNILFFLEPLHSSNKTQINKQLIDKIEHTLTTLKTFNLPIKVNYYGGTAIAVANANRIKQDIFLTVSIAFILLFVLFYGVFRKVKIIALLFFPILLGAGFSIALLSLIENSLSSIALSIGAVLIGISIDYSLHLFAHYRSTGSIQNTLKAIALPVLMSGATTISAFLCLFILNSEALSQLGLFVAITIFMVAILVLTVIPYLLSKIKNIKPKNNNLLFDKITSYNLHKNKLAVIAILCLSLVFYFTSDKLTFNTDISSLNYMPNHLVKAEEKIKQISSEANSSVYAITTGKSLEEALEKAEAHVPYFEDCKKEGYYSSMASATDLILSEKKQKTKINQWKQFWDKQNRDSIKQLFIETGKEYSFKPKAFKSFYNNIGQEPQLVPVEGFSSIIETFLQNYLIERDSAYSVVAILKVDQQKREKLFNKIDEIDDVLVIDKRGLFSKFIEELKTDFSNLITLSFIIIFCILFLFLGRIELAIITYVPILLSWLWTIGLMGLFNIEFNIFNIIISTFIFGLGVDYCIFLTRGLLIDFKYGNKPIKDFRLSILLSALTTIAALGVLILAKHPALKSIASVSIFGIISVVLIANTILPLLFTILTRLKKEYRKYPITLKNTIISLGTFSIFLAGSILLTAIIPILYILPLPRKTVKFIFHYLLFSTCNFGVKANITSKLRHIDKEKLDFSKPSILISNHQSHIDLALILMLHPKIIVLTNKWVWNNPFYGLIVKFADYYPVYRGLEGGTERIAKKVKQGYSVLVFPEGTRTMNGKINRFHQGALNLADEINLEIQPIMIHGAYESLPKYDFFMRGGHITLKFFDRIKVNPVDIASGLTYRKQTKELTAFYRREFEKLKTLCETPSFCYDVLSYKYIYKGPILEWYFKIKVLLEKKYSLFNSIIPIDAKVVDIGCGYGFLACMLNLVSEKRKIIGYDYDEEKIAVASQIASLGKGLEFKIKDITCEEVEESDVYILNDILHYIPEKEQIRILEKCFKKLKPNGKIIVRDANADMKLRTKVTKLTELFSTRLLRFNKITYNNLCFISGQKIINLAHNHGFNVEILDNTKYTSNLIYLIERKKNT